MFVLCPHCHFLVGIDPRTGKPPAACPKCGGMMVEPLPESHAEGVPVAATPLAPFAPVELPSVAPTLPEPELAPGLEPASVAPEPIAPEPMAAPAPAPPAAIETAAAAAAAQPASRWWSRWKREPAAAAASAAPAALAAPIDPTATSAPVPTTPATPIATPAPQADPVGSPRADAMIAAIQGRRRAPRKIAEPPPPRIEPPTVVAAVEVEVDALPSAVRIEDVAATTVDAASIETPADAPVESPIAMPVATPAKRPRRAPVATAVIADADPATAAHIDSAVPDAAPVDIAPEPPHPLRRRTDFDPNASTEASAGTVPPHPLRRRTDAPSFTRPRVRANAASRMGWRSLAVAGGLSLLLVLQLLLAQRDTLAASPRWRPTIAAMCAPLRCGLPPWREPAAFTMLSRDVRPHPNAPGTLLINASFRNDARWPQPWPHLLLTLSDLDGRMVGARSFAAGEYLGAAPTQSELAPGQTAAVTLSVVEPAPNIVAFTFDFR